VREGVAPALVENAAKLVGMPLGPLQLTDEVSIDLGAKIARATRAAMGEAYADGDVDEVVFWLEGEGRLGRKSASGFYAYDEKGKRTGLWDGLGEKYAVSEDQPELTDVQHRLLMMQALEAVRAFEEGVLMDIREGDVASILGWGFAPWTGGVISWLDMIGAAKAVEICDRLEAAHGARFKAPALLRDLAESGETFYGRYGDGKALAAA
jgi:3-hydroxyacyl-CoA dehydrogenase/enoyl-CoA hydratase/3-hydroxybutyryl-CoA epimerase